MTPSPLVPVEGAIARPRVTPLDIVPSFGREWTFRGAPGARPGRHCLATLTTSCIDVDRPHSACRWQPRPVAISMPVSAGAPVVPAAVAGTRIRRSHDRRARYAICWSIGALGIIGWLIAAYEPPAGFGPTYATHAAGSGPDHATSSSGTVRVATVQPDTSTSAPPQRTMAAPVATTAEAPQVMHHVALRPDATTNVPHTASPLRSNDKRSATAAAPARPATASRLAARPPGRSSTVASRAHDQFAPASPAIAEPRDALDDPLTRIAVASALRATQPTRATRTPAADFDWTAQLSHRRLTDTPDAFAR
ncbi:hypothetical protein [Burkholderia cepacia]|uniref:hypothetical protein n=1 Tax=Burkholderia cepacia TaxID=292 RepID=UPI001294E789|nr:hypothetical protein [Burkholderia cepacia]QFS36080.1 hypothetical protein BURCE16_04935 [Burkholderia cepacia]